MAKTIVPSGYYYPNRIARIFVQSIAESVGEDQFGKRLNEAGLPQYMQNPPPDNMKREFDFADFTAIHALLDVSEAANTGRNSYWKGLKLFSGMAGFGAMSIGFQALPYRLKIKTGLTAMATIFSTLSDQLTEIVDHGEHLDYVIHRCPVCWMRHDDRPICGLVAAMLDEGLFWLTEEHFKIVETSCHATGGSTCTFEITLPPQS
jgi:hypothetical protein